MREVPEIRIRAVNAREVDPRREWVLYWMVAFRRTRANFALQRAVRWAEELQRPLLILEAVRTDYPYASDRLHRFILDGMCDNEELTRESHALYYPYVEREPGEGKGLLAALGARSCVVVTDDWPSFFVPQMVEAAGRKLDVRLEAVDGNGLLPIRATPRAFQTAASFRLYLRRNLAPYLSEMPERDPLQRPRFPPLGALPSSISRRWPSASRELLDGSPRALAALPIDHSVPVVEQRGGSISAHARLRAFFRANLSRYDDARADPGVDATSRMSPYLHFGHICVHEIVDVLARLEERQGRTLSVDAKGRRKGMFGLSPCAEAFLDELVTWRELGINTMARREDATSYESIPEWARRTLERHRKDARPRLQTRRALEQGETPDRVFNAAQRQLLAEGWIHNSARMIWGKKILEYSATPEAALKTMFELMNRYSLDGRDTNSVAGVFWVFGRYDRPWRPERPIFGTLRYLSSDTPEKLRKLRAYVERYAPDRASP